MLCSKEIFILQIGTTDTHLLDTCWIAAGTSTERMKHPNMEMLLQTLNQKFQTFSEQMHTAFLDVHDNYVYGYIYKLAVDTGLFHWHRAPSWGSNGKHTSFFPYVSGRHQSIFNFEKRLKKKSGHLQHVLSSTGLLAGWVPTTARAATLLSFINKLSRFYLTKIDSQIKKIFFYLDIHFLHCFCYNTLWACIMFCEINVIFFMLNISINFGFDKFSVSQCDTVGKQKGKIYAAIKYVPIQRQRFFLQT